MNVRVRFAPSPTGFLHVGGARTALLNWLFARHHGGTFVLRVEDTDSARERPEFRAEIFRALQWLGIEEDEGPTKGGAYSPYAQSERSDRYAAALAELVRSQAVYPCFCSAPPEASDDGEAETPSADVAVIATGANAGSKTGTAPGAANTLYAKRCRCGALSEPEREAALAASPTSPAWRMRVDQSRAYEVQDLIRGLVTFPPGEVEDFIVAKAGGAPLYNFAAAVDDAAMEITHIIRGEEHLANTPKQMLLARALGYAVPQFAHLPIILNAERKKLSKRDGATAVSDYERSGFLPEALRNFLVLLGWSPGNDRELLTLEEMIRDFTLERVQKHGAVFDVVKLTWMNGEYVKTASLETLTSGVQKLLARDPAVVQYRTNTAHVGAVCALLQERAKTLAEIAAQTYFFSTAAQLEWDPAAVEKRAGTTVAHEYLGALQELLGGLNDFSRAGVESAIRELAQSSGAKAGDYIGPLRVAITGTAVSPGIFEVCEVLGRDVVVARISAFLAAHAPKVAL